MRDGLYQVTRGAVCAGFVVEGGRVRREAPILRARGYAGWVRRVDEFYRVLFTGSRDWRDVEAVRWALVKVWERLGCRADQLVVVQGMARGLDSIARELAVELGMRFEDHPCMPWEWRRYGKRAGHLRNERMVAAGARGCVAFPLGESSGTRGCMAAAERAGIKVWNRGDRLSRVA